MFNSRLLQTLCSIVLVAFTGTFAVPIGATAMAAKLAQVPVTPAAAPSAADHYGAAVAALKQWLANPDADAAQNSGLGTDTKGLIQKLAGNGDSPRLRALRQHRDDLEAAKADVDADMSAMEQKLIAHKLPAIILNRQHTAVATMQARHIKLQQMIAAVEQHEEKIALGKAAKATSKTAGSPHAQLASYLSALNPERRSIKTDPKHLPFHFGKHDKLPTDPKIAFAHSMMTARADGKIPTSTPNEHDPIYLPNGHSLPGKRGAPLPKTAKKLALRGVGGGLLSGAMLAVSAASTAATDPNLAATEDVQFTPAIQALAAQLNNNPVTIYNWVYNNIEFVPTYGSIQGSDMTLQTLKGNAYDIASLLIALYRVSGIPARYAYGLVDLPAANVENWVGGVNVPEAAQQLLGQGGVPNIGVVSGGKITKIRMEHVWVEAEVDYYPSRGAVNRNPDTWVPVDAAYKQYTYTQGMDLQDKVPFDMQSLITQTQQGATVNQQQGWMQGFNTTAAKTQFLNYQQQILNFVKNENPNATTGDVFGFRQIVKNESALLTGSLPYPINEFGDRFSAIPDEFRHSYSEALYDANGNLLLTYTASLPSLAGKRITLSFVPATAADEQVISGLLPQTHTDGSLIQLSELPGNLPGYMIQLTAQLRVDGVAVAQSNAGASSDLGLSAAPSIQMGANLTLTQSAYSPDRDWEFAADSYPTAGEVYATAIDLEGTPSTLLNNQNARMTQTQAQVSARQTSSLTGDLVTGDVLYGAMLTYFGMCDTTGQLTAKSGGFIEYRRPSFGNVIMGATTRWFFGFPQSVTFDNVTMDTGFVTTITSDKNNNISAIIAYNSIAGMRYSAYEGLMLGLDFNPSNDPAHEAVSTIKIFAMAESLGQNIYTINSTNLVGALASISISDAAKQDITNAVQGGNVVFVPQNNVTIGGWTGTGYVISDSSSGGCAYKISDGQNGGTLSMGIGFVLGALAYYALGITINCVPFWSAFAAAVLAVIILDLYMAYETYDATTFGCYMTGFALGFGAAAAKQGLGGLAGWFFSVVLAFPNAIGSTPIQTCLQT